MDNKIILKRSNNLVWREVDGEIAIISTDNKLLHTLNSVGSRIWELLDGNHDMASIAGIISAEYEKKKDIVEPDVEQYIQNLKQLNLLES